MWFVFGGWWYPPQKKVKNLPRRKYRRTISAQRLVDTYTHTSCYFYIIIMTHCAYWWYAELIRHYRIKWYKNTFNTRGGHKGGVSKVFTLFHRLNTTLTRVYTSVKNLENFWVSFARSRPWQCPVHALNGNMHISNWKLKGVGEGGGGEQINE